MIIFITEFVIEEVVEVIEGLERLEAQTLDEVEVEVEEQVLHDEHDDLDL